MNQKRSISEGGHIRECLLNLIILDGGGAQPTNTSHSGDHIDILGSAPLNEAVLRIGESLFHKTNAHRRRI